jgi:dTDP-4-dehydrorhamnose reductase
VRVLVIGADNPVGTELRAEFQRWGRHECIPMTMSAARWKSERQAKKSVRRDRPDLILDVRMPQVLAAEGLPAEQDIESSHWLAKACQRSGIHFFHVSSDEVYAGTAAQPYREDQAYDRDDPRGRLLQQAEDAIRGACDEHLILRLGPLFAARENNLMTRVLAELEMTRSVVLDHSLYRCPVVAADAARVIAAVLDQISAGAQPWMTFHYASTDRTTRFEFAEAVLASASQFRDFSEAVVRPTSEDDAPKRSLALDCSLIRDTFAIKQVPWRSFVSPTVRQYFADQTE